MAVASAMMMGIPLLPFGRHLIAIAIGVADRRRCGNFDVRSFGRVCDGSEPERQHEHQTKESVWGTIVVLEGRLEYTINEPHTEVVILDPGTLGIVEPTVRHQVKPLGKVRFYVEFHR